MTKDDFVEGAASWLKHLDDMDSTSANQWRLALEKYLAMQQGFLDMAEKEMVLTDENGDLPLKEHAANALSNLTFWFGPCAAGCVEGIEPLDGLKAFVSHVQNAAKAARVRSKMKRRLQ